MIPCLAIAAALLLLPVSVAHAASPREQAPQPTSKPASPLAPAARGVNAEPRHTSPPIAGFWTLRTVTTGTPDVDVPAPQAIQEFAFALAAASGQLTIAPVRRIVTIADGAGGARTFSTIGEPQPFDFDGHPVIVTTLWSRDTLVQRFQTPGEHAIMLALTYERADSSTDLIATIAIEHGEGDRVMLQRRIYSSDAID